MTVTKEVRGAAGFFSTGALGMEVKLSFALPCLDAVHTQWTVGKRVDYAELQDLLSAKRRIEVWRA